MTCTRPAGWSPIRALLVWGILLATSACGPSQIREPATRAQRIPATAVAVADFEGGSVPASDAGNFWQRALALQLLADLRASDSLRPVERSQLQAILNEQKLSVSALSDPSTQLRLGRIVGAQLFVFGTYTILPGDSVILTARMVEVETGRVLKSEKIAGTLDDMGNLSRQLALLMVRGLDEQLAARTTSRLAASTGNGPPLEAVRLFSEGLDLEDQRRVGDAVEMYARALAVYPKYDEARERLERASEQLSRQ